jgi:NADPH-dependent curcumin reductase CurA
VIVVDIRMPDTLEGNEMMPPLNRQFVLAARPNGLAMSSDFALVEKAIPSLGEGEILFRNTLISLDPYQRNLMGNGPSELPSIDLGTPMPGPTVAIIERSRNADFAVGDHVVTWSGWQEYGVSDGSDLRKVDADTAPLSTALGILGHTGLTAWVGSSQYLEPRPGGTFVVTAAAGAVGSMAAQIAKLRGHRVVGIAGGPQKLAYLKDELGLDEAVDYKADDFEEQLARALPDGLDLLFDNVGGPIFEALMPHFNMHARIVVCGLIAGYNDSESPHGANRLPQLLNLFLYRFIEIRGFSLLDHLGDFSDFLAEVAPWVDQGKIRYSEQIVDGFETIPETFLKLFDGRNTGKLIVKAG